jgi:1-acyl-sn-glycerol-3-phosphate acyltransferase
MARPGFFLAPEVELKVPVLPKAVPSRGNWLSAAIGRWALALAGWRFEGNFPDIPKSVLVVAPHTSNWDFPVGLAAMYALGLRVAFLAKDSLFRPPLGAFLRWWGGVPVDRSAAHGVVEQSAQVMKQRQRLYLVVAPEGTRKKVTRWKSGFYRIAHAAGVPLVPVAFDYGARVIHLMPPFEPTGDYQADLPRIQELFVGVLPKNPDQF